jgi:hypothetical protein
VIYGKVIFGDLVFDEATKQSWLEASVASGDKREVKLFRVLNEDYGRRLFEEKTVSSAAIEVVESNQETPELKCVLIKSDTLQMDECQRFPDVESLLWSRFCVRVWIENKPEERYFDTSVSTSPSEAVSAVYTHWRKSGRSSAEAWRCLPRDFKVFRVLTQKNVFVLASDAIDASEVYNDSRSPSGAQYGSIPDESAFIEVTDLGVIFESCIRPGLLNTWRMVFESPEAGRSFREFRP